MINVAKDKEKVKKKDEPELIAQYANIWGQDEADSIADVLESDTLVEGPKVKEFEREFAKFVGAKHCVLMPNPTLALYAALIIARTKITKPYVRIPDFGYMEVFNACLMANYKPILCDVSETGILELRDNEAGVAIHFNGRKAKPTVLEVCFDAIDIHTTGLLSVYDFNYERHLTLGGKGGAVCTDDDTEYNNLLRLKDQGRLEINTPDYEYWGIDLQVTELQAAFGLAQLPLLQKKLDTIRGFYKRITDEFKGSTDIVFLSESPSMYIDVYVKKPIELGKFLAEHNIAAERLPKPLHMQTICQVTPRLDKDFKFGSTLYNAGLYLPSSPILEEKHIDRIISVLKDFTKLK